jgi:hypothetical protein
LSIGTHTPGAAQPIAVGEADGVGSHRKGRPNNTLTGKTREGHAGRTVMRIDQNKRREPA